MPFDLADISIVVQIIFLEGILSIDNAAILGALVSTLPKDEMVPWPGPLKSLGPPVHRIFGGQRAAALKVGLLGAYVGRGLMLVLANFVINNPILKILGAYYLIKLGLEHLGSKGDEDDASDRAEKLKGKSFWSVVIAVELADLAFSLDNVVVVVALSSNLYLVMFGVFIGIVTMRFAAGVFTWMILKEPILKPAAYMVVLNIGVELMLHEFLHIEFSSAAKFAISAGTLVLFVVYARLKFLHFLQPVFDWVARGFAAFNDLFDWILAPAIFVIKLIFKGFVFVIKHASTIFPRNSRAIEYKEHAVAKSEKKKEGTRKTKGASEN